MLVASECTYSTNVAAVASTGTTSDMNITHALIVAKLRSAAPSCARRCATRAPKGRSHPCSFTVLMPATTSASTLRRLSARRARCCCACFCRRPVRFMYGTAPHMTARPSRMGGPMNHQMSATATSTVPGAQSRLSSDGITWKNVQVEE